MRRLAITGVVVGVAAVGAFFVADALLRPPPGDRATLAWIFLLGAAGATAIGVVLDRGLGRAGSVRAQLGVVALVGVVLVALAVVVSSRMMFLSSHDLRLVLVVVGFAVVAGAAVALIVGGAMADDIRRLATAARRMAAGDLTVRSEVARRDEVGDVANAIDELAARLEGEARSRRELEASRRRFLAAIGHDLRTPLTAIRAAVEALQDGLADDPDRYLATIAGDVDHLAGLVDDLFLLARIEAGAIDLDLHPADLVELAGGVVDSLQPVAAAKAVRLDVIRPSKPAVAAVAPAAITRVLRNLLDNAVRFAPEASEVAVAIEAEAETVAVEIRDQGPGFPPDLDVFADFVTGDPARARAGGGAGLGLAIARGMVEAHGGRIWTQGGPGGVVRFEVPTRG